MSKQFDYFIFYKPYQVLSQFSPEIGKETLKNYVNVKKNIYPVGRLDFDSEGLLLLTNDKTINSLVLHPTQHFEKEYYVQVEGTPTKEALHKLSAGITITINATSYTTQPCVVKIIDTPNIEPRNPPIRIRENIPTTWLSLIISEGKNRQVRKMTAAIGYPTLRLVRWRIGTLQLQGLKPGQLLAISKNRIANKS
jgi:23S rRNA pseudouridine2457 synthase